MKRTRTPRVAIKNDYTKPAKNKIPAPIKLYSPLDYSHIKQGGAKKPRAVRTIDA